MKASCVLSVCFLLAVFAGVPHALGDWFGSSDTKKTNTPTKTVNKKDPSVFQKMGDGTKKFVNGVGNTLGLNKKPAAKKNPNHSAWNTPAKEPEKKNFLTSMFSAKEPEKPKRQTPSEWLGNPKPESVY
jgi:hypothetical protein